MNLQEIEIRPFSTSSLHETFLMEVSGRFFEIGKDVAELLTYFKCNGCEEASIEEYSKQNGRLSKEEILMFLNDFAKKLEKESELPNKRKAFLYNRELISPNVINKYSSLLAPLFNKWLGNICLDLGVGNPYKITRVRYVPQTDSNFIIPGNRYRLEYWNNASWKLIEEQTATNFDLHFSNVPAHQLYILHNLTSGIEERIFT